MISNVEIANLFEEMADLLELSGENAFRIRAYRNGAKAIAEMSDSAATWVREERDLTSVEGIGETLAEKTKVIVETGHLPQLEKLRAAVPASLRSIMAIPGLGAKKAMKLFQELGVQDLAGLRSACESGLVANLKGFGEKTQTSILANMQIAEKAATRILSDAAETLVQHIRKHMSQCPTLERIEFAGSYRRGKESVGDLDVLVTSVDPTAVMDHFGKLSMIHEVIQRGDTKMSVRVQDSFQVDLRVVDDASWGAALQYFTGSKEHNVRIRSMAKAKRYKINEYGVFTTADGAHRVAGANEEEIYRLLDLPWIPPELREDRLEFEPDSNKTIQQLIELGDVRGDLHMHTHATDGENSIEEMVEAAKQRGLCYIAITDHSKRVSMARGLDENRLREQWKTIDAINRNSDGTFWIFKGVECDILENGKMDLADDCLAEADWVIGSIHYGQKQPRAQITERILNAIHHPHVHMIGHPTGRLIGRREPYDVDLEQVMSAAVEKGKVLELNANPHRLDLNDLHTTTAVRLGITIAIDTDAHSTQSLDLMKFGVRQARRAGVRASQVLNTLSLSDIRPRLGVR
ncbi:DNA polymerase/3'-5' exonuclease PolX [Pirellula sp. SH-Sr6A]|uniref:DNA polymerase/3'-5' exonuclease PolX n=1 Tax=Pirellula sp. SH-Sr6A TaxID=1632865 RepID=UPI00078E94AF|nr:DNA polymerase/3'-5' exonuclease PolX [Pirellula sp. SH-Sr6A]AMV33906.1 DNA polymerase/3'-5' exonuclease PolX [Pirellula sp. SH-Sr6A]